MNLATPKNQTSEILYFLLTNDKINFSYIYAMTGILNLSARISDLRLNYGLEIPCVEVETKNKFGRKISYGTWSLKDKEQARIIYSKINR
jgi:hypothetical protein